MVYNVKRCELNWSFEKNEKLIQERNISFSEIMDAMYMNNYFGPLPNKSRNHKGQNIFVVYCKGYTYVVPFVKEKNILFLKTIIPSHKYHQLYGGMFYER